MDDQRDDGEGGGLKFKRGESYPGVLFAGLLFIFVTMVISAFAVGNPSLSTISFPILGAILLASELRSGVALDGYMCAKYPKGTSQFGRAVAWRVVWVIGMTAMSYVVVANFTFPRKS
jgi:hypothetical protein